MRLHLIFLCLLLAFPLFAAETIKGKVVSVADGDTITVLRDKVQIKVRLYGIDAPEKAQDFGTVSRTFTSDLCFGKEVEVEVSDTDRYGRKIGKVNLPDGRSVNNELIAAGLAWWYEAYAKDDETLKQLQDEARMAKRGLWSRPDAVAPWEFRKRKRASTLDSPPTPRVDMPVMKESPVADGRTSSVVYLTNTGKKYHRSSCRMLNESKTAIPLDEAKKQGFGPCGLCFKH